MMLRHSQRSRELVRRSTPARVLVVMLAGLMVTACAGTSHPKGSSPTTGGSSATTAGTPRNGGSVTFGEYSSIPSLDPTRIQGFGVAGGTEGAAVYGELMRFDTPTKQFVPSMAQSLTHNADYTVWTLTLRPGVEFTDGTPYDSAAVVANFKHDLDPASHATVTGLLAGFIKSFTASSPTTVVFDLKQPWTGFAYTLSYTPGLIAAPSYLTKLAAGDSRATPIGAGPFKVASFRPGEELTLVPNQSYFGGPPHLASLNFILVPGGVPTLQSFDTGQLQAAVIRDPEGVKEAQAAHVPSHSDLFPLGSVILENTRPNDILHNAALREALALGTSAQIFNQRVSQGAGISDNAIFPQQSSWYQPSATGVPYDLAKAKALVAQVKKQTGWNGTLRFECTNVPTQAAVPVALEAMWTPLGINLQVTNDISTSQHIINIVVKRDFDTACWGYGVQDGDPFPGLWLQLDQTSVNNFAGFSDPRMTAALDALRTASTESAEKAALTQLNQAWNQTWPAVNLGAAQELIINKPNLHGLVYSIGGIVLFDQAWLS